MTRTALRTAMCVACLACASVALRAEAGRDERLADLDAQRDQLIDRIIRGEDFAKNSAAFKALVEKRDELKPTSERARRDAEEFIRARSSWEQEWRKTADSEVAWRCRLEADPTKLHDMNAAGVPEWPGDWGPITRKETIHLEGKNALDEGEDWVVYEVKGKRRTYHFRDKGFGIFRNEKFEANKGDLALVCDGGYDTDERLPPEWQKDFQRSGFAVKLKSPPRIAKKAKWNPLQITNTALFWAVKDVKWRFGDDAYVLDVIDVEKDLGNGRWLIDVDRDVDAVVEVPPDLPRRELMVPGTKVWAILGKPRFDKTVRKLVLTVEDLEDRYVDEP